MNMHFHASFPSVQSWEDFFAEETKKSYYQQLHKRLEEEVSLGRIIYPPPSQLFEAYRLTPLKDIRVVILGQDPYHGAGQAHGLAFSVPKGVAIPPSLKNIFKELTRDLSIPTPPEGDLTRWAQQGVFLLNSSLSVEAHQAGSHRDFGWHRFTSATIAALQAHHPHVVFMLWGRHAQNARPLIDASRHCILSTSHPSPLSAHAGFLGCGHFSACNRYLSLHHKGSIAW